METAFARDFFILLVTALTGGILARVIKFPPFIGYLLIGLLLNYLFPQGFFGINNLSQLGLILLLFTTGVELSLDRVQKFLRVSLIGATVQILLSGLVLFCLLNFLSMEYKESLILALGFALSSTAVVVKSLSDRNETRSLHGELLIGWLLFQDIAVIPILALLKFLGSSSFQPHLFVIELVKAFILILVFFKVVRLTLVKVFDYIAKFDSRELLVFATLAFGLGSALLFNLLGISAVIGAFIAGVLISETMEKHSVLAETRPVRDMFVGIFFLSLGFLVKPALLIPLLPVIILVCLIVIVVKTLVSFIISVSLRYHGKTAVLLSLGLSQIGEFSIVIFSLAYASKLLSENALTIGVSATILSLVIFPFLYKYADNLWRVLLKSTKGIAFLEKLITGWNISHSPTIETDHIVICGYGRVGRWVGRVFKELGINFVVIDYNYQLVKELRENGMDAIYGDPTEKEILVAAGIEKALLVVIAIPDASAQEEVILLARKLNSKIKIVTRIHNDLEEVRVKNFAVDKIVQPEFEASMSIVKYILLSKGKDIQEARRIIKNMRISHAKNSI